jgi:hypothetical protein
LRFQHLQSLSNILEPNAYVVDERYEQRIGGGSETNEVYNHQKIHRRQNPERREVIVHKRKIAEKKKI